MSRRESWEATRPDGVVVLVERDIDTGEQTVTPTGERIGKPGESLPVIPADPSLDQTDLDPAEPRGNASREDWAAWADSLGVVYPEDAKRDDIKALVSSATE